MSIHLIRMVENGRYNFRQGVINASKRRLVISARCLVGCLIMILSSHVQAFSQPLDYAFVLPENSGMWNIKEDFGAVGDGVADDTEAFIKAFYGEGAQGYRALFIPEGTYIVSNTALILEDKKKVVMGAGRDKTIIRLKENSPLFQDPQNPVRFIDAKGSQHSAQNFFMHIKHLTIEIGEGNPGATALFFHTNNTGSVYDVNIRTTDPNKAGFCGLELNSWPGPGLIKYVDIDGFDYGIRVHTDQYSMTFEHVSIRNSRIIGFRNEDNTCSIRKMTIENTPLAFFNSGNQSMVSLIECDFSGAGETAILNENAGMMIVRDLATNGFDNAIHSFNDTIAGATVDEWLSHSPKFLFPSKQSSLRLPIEETPQMPYPSDTSQYMVLRDLNGDGDITQEFQDAIDSGVETIFVPPGWGKGPRSDFWVTSNTIIIRGNVKRIIGIGNSMIIEKPGAGKPAYRIEDGTSDVVIFENFYSNYGTNFSYKYEHASKRTLVLKMGSASYHNVVDGCTLFVEDVVGDPWVFNNMTVWIRDINTETYDFVHVTNNNSKVWTLGHKTEKDQVVYHTLNGGQTELLGALLYKNNQRQPHPAFIVDESEVSLSYRAKGLPYNIHVEETRNGVNRRITSGRTHGTRMALYAGYAGGAPAEPTDLSATAVAFNAIELSWNDNSDNEDGFIIERSLNTTSFTPVDTVPENTTSYTDTGLHAETKYYYRVLAVNQVANSWTEYTRVADATTLADDTSVDDVTELKQPFLYPNPVRNQLFISLEGVANHSNGFIQIIDVMGRLICQQPITEGSLHAMDVGWLPSGHYGALIINEKSIFPLRFIKE